MSAVAPTPAPALPGTLGLLLVALAVGAAAAFSLPLALGALAVAVVGYGFARSRRRSEILLGAFWVAFVTYETIFADVTIGGFFYPFYLAFLAAIVLFLLRDGLRVHVPLLISYAAFLVVVMLSFVGFRDAIDFEVIQRLIAYLMGGIALLQFRSLRGTRAVLVAAMAGAVAVSAWVIASSIAGGFTYRGDIDVDQNVVAFFVGFGVVIAAALGLDASARRGRRGRLVPLALVLGVTLYASLLLASRGIALALALALGGLVLLEARRRPGSLRFVLVLALLTGGALLLPGGQGLLERFEGERIESGGSRLPIWEATLEDYAEGDLRDLALGRGWAASRDFVASRFGPIASTHNAWVQVLYEFGLVGLAAFAWLHLFPLLLARRAPSPDGPLVVGLVTFLVGANFSTNSPDGFMYWVALALALALASGLPRVPAAAAAPRRGGAA